MTNQALIKSLLVQLAKLATSDKISKKDIIKVNMLYSTLTLMSMMKTKNPDLMKLVKLESKNLNLNVKPLIKEKNKK
ncbi:hypothetical protein [Mesoplasma photuris]|uniref:hypothetical protein n=1 Tax=Mesoplasma photuris TaxID=217731 RepID=UPI0004E17C00|nr:hypothetical protein [Mesoplasma photuris]